MNHFTTLIKSQSAKKRENYVARVQTGFSKDGGPEYRYFKDNDSHQAYLRNRGSSDKQRANKKDRGGERLAQKTEQERDESREYVSNIEQKAERKPSVKTNYERDPYKRKEETSNLKQRGGMNKSLALFVGVD